MYYLGINSVFHETSACLLRDGEIIAAVEEERLNGIKHGKKALYTNPHQLPYRAIAFCLQRAGIHLKDVAHIGFSFSPESRLRNNICCYDLDDDNVKRKRREEELVFFHLLNEVEKQFTSDAAENISPRLKAIIGLPDSLAEFRAHSRFSFLDHHLCHAASSFYPSGFASAAVMTVDGIGEDSSTWLGFGDGHALVPIKTISYPHSLGFLYERFTEFLGFQKNHDEYKVAGLASYGCRDPRENRYYRLLKDHIIELTEDGEFRINNEITRFRMPLRLSGLEKLFGPPRKYGEALVLSGIHADIAAALQMVLDEAVLHLAKSLRRITGQGLLTYGGGVALNCVTNMALVRDAGYKSVFIQPAAHDAGTAMGAAMLLAHRNHKCPRRKLENIALGPRNSNSDIEESLCRYSLKYRHSSDIALETAQFLFDNKVVAWFQGGVEWGPRALGYRSLLGNPVDPAMKQRMNEIKSRDQFRPLCPSVLEEEQFDWFDEKLKSPYMLFAFTCKNDRLAGRPRSEWIPSALHVDHTARLQTVSIDRNPLFHQMIAAFSRLTQLQLGVSVPMVINTSFNIKGKPIVAGVDDALRCFFTEAIDVLVLGDFIVEK